MSDTSLAIVLRRVMRERQWSQTALADHLGVTQGAISKWMAGARRPRDRKVRDRLLRWGVDPRAL